MTASISLTDHVDYESLLVESTASIHLRKVVLYLSLPLRANATLTTDCLSLLQKGLRRSTFERSPLQHNIIRTTARRALYLVPLLVFRMQSVPFLEYGCIIVEREYW